MAMPKPIQVIQKSNTVISSAIVIVSPPSHGVCRIAPREHVMFGRAALPSRTGRINRLPCMAVPRTEVHIKRYTKRPVSSSIFKTIYLFSRSARVPGASGACLAPTEAERRPAQTVPKKLMSQAPGLHSVPVGAERAPPARSAPSRSDFAWPGAGICSAC